MLFTHVLVLFFIMTMLTIFFGMNKEENCHGTLTLSLAWFVAFTVIVADITMFIVQRSG